MSMSTERVTVSIPAELRQAGQAEADHAGTSFSAVVTDALRSHLRGQAIDAWLAEFEAEHGAFSEDELAAIAADAGVPYVPPRPRT
jgi:hypothetical protein